jgi:hypothetical protein
MVYVANIFPILFAFNLFMVILVEDKEMYFI